ncbi:hypothetical protein KP509_02G099600 [Ceratopteris richardii]|nr:hypothetical protein KP509_02G099600 [Ceratopteris richardii]
MHTSFLPLPLEVSYLIGLVAFAQELLLFHLRRPDAGLEARYCTLLQVPITASIMALIAMIASPMSVLPPLSLAASLFLQGTWLIQMGLSFFTSIYMPKGCALQMRGEGDYVIKCLGNDMALMHGNAVATLQFNCHMALLLILLLPMYSFLRRRCGPPNVYDLNYEMVSVVEPRIGEKHSSSPVEPPASAFSLESEEYEDGENLKPEQQHQDANGLHRVIN